MRKRFVEHFCKKCQKVTKHRIRPGEEIFKGSGFRTQLIKCTECK